MAEQKKLKASERLTIMEQQLLTATSTLNITAKRTGEMELLQYTISRENELLREALQLVHNKLDAVISLVNNKSELTDESIDKIIVAKKIDTLAAVVTNQLNLGKIEVSEEIGDTSFAVGRELNKDGTVANPRIQFVIGKLIEELKTKFIGMKVGELLRTEDDGLDIEITEIYNILPEPSLEETSDLPVEEVAEVAVEEVAEVKEV